MATPKHKLTETKRGWLKRIAGELRWVCSKSVAPSAADADAFYQANFAELWTPVERPAGILTVELLCNTFVDYQDKRLTAGEISQRTYDEYADCAKDFATTVGADAYVDHLTPAHFAAFKERIRTWGVARRAKWIILCRSIFNWASGHPLNLTVPAYGRDFRIPSRREFRAAKAAIGDRTFRPRDVWLMLYDAAPRLRAAILLAINAGLGPAEIRALRWEHIDLSRGWIMTHRVRTHTEVRCPLWPETVSAIRELPQEGNERLIPLSHGGLAASWWRLLDRCGIKHRGFYWLRRTFRTLADEAGDARAAEMIMGHVLDDVGSLYVGHVNSARLHAVTDSVRQALILTPDGPGCSLPNLRSLRREAWIAQLSAARKVQATHRRSPPPAKSSSDRDGRQDEKRRES